MPFWCRRMKNLLLLIPLLFTVSCRETNMFEIGVVTPEDPVKPLCDPIVVGRTVIVIHNDEGPPTVVHGFLVDDDCDESTPPIFVEDEKSNNGRNDD